MEHLTENSKTKIYDHISYQGRRIVNKIEHYFQCTRCTDCKSTVKNRRLLSDHEKEINDEIKSLIRMLFKELTTSIDSLEVRVKTDLSIHKLNTKMDAKLKQKVGEAIRSRKGRNLSKHTIETMFDNLWHEATHDILFTATRLEKGEDIEATVQATIVSLLGRDCYFFIFNDVLTHSLKDSGGGTFQTEPTSKFILRYT